MKNGSKLATVLGLILAVLMGLPINGSSGNYLVGNVLLVPFVFTLCFFKPVTKKYVLLIFLGSGFIGALAFVDFLNGVDSYSILKATLRNMLLLYLPVLSHELCLRYGVFTVLLWYSAMGTTTYLFYLIGGGLNELNLGLLTKWRSGASIGLLAFICVYGLVKQRFVVGALLVSLGVLYPYAFQYRSAGYAFFISGIFIVTLGFTKTIPTVIKIFVSVTAVIVMGFFYLTFATNMNIEDSQFILQMDSIYSRLEGLKNASVDIINKPITGYGFMTKWTAVATNYGDKEVYVHSYLLQLPLEYGLLGLFGIVLYTLGLLKCLRLYHNWRHHSLPLSIMAMITPFVVLGFYDCAFSLFNARSWLFGVVLGVVYYVERIRSNNHIAEKAIPYPLEEPYQTGGRAR